MKFEEEFFKNEVREGFFVSSMMKRAWAAQIEVLEEFEKMCKENNIRYFAAYGTLLGAVRHGGFIPWDDDIDIWMLREDYEKLRTIAKNGNLPNEYVLKTAFESEDCTSTFGRIINYYSIGFNEDRMLKYHGFPFCAGLDIFPLDYVPEGKKGELFKEDIKTLVQLYSLFKDGRETHLNKKMRDLLEKQYQFKINPKKNITNQIARMLEKTIKKYCTNKTDTLARVYGWAAKGYKLDMKAEWFEETEHVKFENYMIPAPAKYHDVLESQYKNHMEVVRAFEDLHDYPFYKKQDQYFYEAVNQRITSANYDENEIEEYHSSNSFTEVKQSIFEKIDVLKKINDCIVKLVDTGDVSQILDFLENSQDIAIKIGNILEERYAEEITKDIIGDLESYCENLYNMSVGLAEDSDKFVNSFKCVMELVDIIRDKVSNIKSEALKKIVFIFESQKDWDKYRPLYNQLSAQDNVKCYAIPIPYFMLNSLLKVDENSFRFDGDKISSEEEFCDYSTFEYESIDCIIKSNPYDNSSYTDIIRPFFFSDNLHKFCKKIIHVPTLDIIDFTTKDVQMREMADCFVKTPSVIYSDYVLLNSETNTNTYRELLNEVSESVKWEEKVLYCSDTEDMAKTILRIVKE